MNNNIINFDTDLNQVEHSQYPVTLQCYYLMDVLPENLDQKLYTYHEYDEEEDINKDHPYDCEFHCPTREAFYQLFRDVCLSIAQEFTLSEPTENFPNCIVTPGDDAFGDICNATDLLKLMTEYDFI